MYRYVHSAPPQYHSNAQYENELIAKGLGRGHISPPTLSLHVYMNVRERGEVMYYNFPELRVSQNAETVQRRLKTNNYTKNQCKGNPSQFLQ